MSTFQCGTVVLDDGRQITADSTPSGCTRSVGVAGDLVLKHELNASFGGQCEAEAQIWDSAPDDLRAFLAPIVATGDGWCVQRKVEKPPFLVLADGGHDDDWLDGGAWEERLPAVTEAIRLLHRFGIFDLSPRQFGWLDGRPCCHDYGSWGGPS